MLKNGALAAILLALALPAAAQDDKFPISGQIGAVAVTGGGELRCIGGEPTNLPFPDLPCTPDTVRIATRAELQTWAPALTEWAPWWWEYSFGGTALTGPNASLLDGPIAFVVNCNFSSAYRGPCWGTFEWQVPAAGGVWRGSWTSPVMDLLTYESVIAMVGRGEGGSLDGLQLKVDGFSNPWDWYITFRARIR